MSLSLSLSSFYRCRSNWLSLDDLADCCLSSSSSASSSGLATSRSFVTF